MNIWWIIWILIILFIIFWNTKKDKEQPISQKNSYSSDFNTSPKQYSNIDIIKYTEYSSNKCDIKWNISFTTWEKIYHLPWCKNYNDTIIDVSYWEKWFCNETDAKNAWWRKAYNCN